MGYPARGKCLSFLKLHGMTMATIGGVVIGVILGILLRLREDPWTPREVMNLFYTHLGYPFNCIARICLWGGGAGGVINLLFLFGKTGY